MKNLFLVGLICLSTWHSLAQEKVTIPAKDILIGRNLRSNTDINARKYVFPGEIQQWHMNDSTDKLILQLQESRNDSMPTLAGKEAADMGTIIQYDLKSQQIQWSRNINYAQTNIDPYDRALIKSTPDFSSYLDSNTGVDVWSARSAICYVNSTRGIAVGIKTSKDGNLSNTYEGYNLKTGELLWRRNINRDYNVNGISNLNDSTIVISANGLHAIHLKTGLGWDYDAHTGTKDYSSTVAANLINVGFSLMLGTDPEITTGHDLITDVVSNTLIDSTGIYMADKKSVVQLNHYGNVLWKNNLPRDMVSRSSLFRKDSLIYMVADGFASRNNESIHYGKPFIACYHIDSGKRLFLSKVGYKNEQILSYEIQQDTICLLSKNKIFRYSLRDGSEIWEKHFKTDSLGELTRFGDSDMFIRSDSGAFSPVRSSPASLVVFTNKNQLLVLNNLLDINTIIPNDRIFLCYLETKDYKFMDMGEATLVTDKNNRPIAQLDISGNAVLFGTKLFESSGNSLIEIDMNEFR